MSAAAGAMNATVRPVVDYAPDPHGGWTFGALTRAIGRTLANNPVAEASATYYGVVARPLQRFTGAAGLGAAQIYAPRAGQMNGQVSTLDSATSAVFLARMARG